VPLSRAGFLGEYRALQSGTARRADQSGLPDFQAQAWKALFAPKDTPQPALDKFTDALDKALDDEPDPQTPAGAWERTAGQGRAWPAGARRFGQPRDRALDADHQGGRPDQLTYSFRLPAMRQAPRLAHVISRTYLKIAGRSRSAINVG